VKRVSLKGKLFYATKENTELQQEVAYLITHLEKTILSEKIIEEDLSLVEKSATKSTYKLSVGFKMCEDKGVKSAVKFISSSTYHKEEATIKHTKADYPSNPKPSFNPKREVRKETPKSREKAFICMFCGRVGHLDEFCFQRKRIERGTLIMPETHIVMRFLIFRLALCLSSLVDLTIAHMVLIHE
jgi:hypothetical protein